METETDFTTKNNSINKDKGDDSDEGIAAETVSYEKVLVKKKRRIQRDLWRRFSHCTTSHQGVRLNLRYVAQKNIKDKEGQVITFESNDPTKAAGERLNNVKTTHITIGADDMDQKKIFISGFTPKISHSGEDQTTKRWRCCVGKSRD